MFSSTKWYPLGGGRYIWTKSSQQTKKRELQNRRSGFLTHVVMSLSIELSVSSLLLTGVGNGFSKFIAYARSSIYDPWWESDQVFGSCWLRMINLSEVGGIYLPLWKTRYSGIVGPCVQLNLIRAVEPMIGFLRYLYSVVLFQF